DILQEEHYYPFGLSMAPLSFQQGTPNRYRYNGKELHSELGLGWYDYGFRWYDPAVARFVSVDPLAEKFPELTTYQYAGNTPIWATDLDGLEPNKINDNLFPDELNYTPVDNPIIVRPKVSAKVGTGVALRGGGVFAEANAAIIQAEGQAQFDSDGTSLQAVGKAGTIGISVGDANSGFGAFGELTVVETALTDTGTPGEKAKFGDGTKVGVGKYGVVNEKIDMELSDGGSLMPLQRQQSMKFGGMEAASNKSEFTVTGSVPFLKLEIGVNVEKFKNAANQFVNNLSTMIQRTSNALTGGTGSRPTGQTLFEKVFGIPNND
ncbi:MAG: RHS repeat-associated core domain-containing protein, partial [Bacteroidota bacterium]